MDQRPMEPAAHGLGIAIVLAISLGLIIAGAAVALTAPLMSVGHLLGGPALIVAGAALLARLLFVQVRRTR